MKPVPDPGEERLGADGRLDRIVSAVINGNDEYVLEAALKLVEAHGGEVTLLSMAPAGITDPIRKALAMGATRAVLVSDPAGVATLLGLPYLSHARRIEPLDGGVRVERLSAAGHDVLEATLPAVVVA